MTPQQIVSASQEQKKYPILMMHPQYRKATISGYRRNPDGSATDDPPGIPGRYEDHWVNNADQESYYASMGYAPKGTADIEAYRKQICGFEEAPSSDYPCARYRLKPDGELDVALCKDASEFRRHAADGWHKTPDAAHGKTAEVVSLVRKPEQPEQPKERARTPDAAALLEQIAALQAQVAALTASSATAPVSTPNGAQTAPEKKTRAPRSEEAKARTRATMLAKKAGAGADQTLDTLSNDAAAG